jgi:hypothetical protein
MEQSNSYIDTLPKELSFDLLHNDIQNYILHIACRPDNPDAHFEGLQNLLMCSRVCKKWHITCKEIYNTILKTETAIIESYNDQLICWKIDRAMNENAISHKLLIDYWTGQPKKYEAINAKEIAKTAPYAISCWEHQENIV